MWIYTFMSWIIFKILMNLVASKSGFKKEKHESKWLCSLLHHNIFTWLSLGLWNIYGRDPRFNIVKLMYDRTVKDCRLYVGRAGFKICSCQITGVKISGCGVKPGIPHCDMVQQHYYVVTWSMLRRSQTTRFCLRLLPIAPDAIWIVSCERYNRVVWDQP